MDSTATLPTEQAEELYESRSIKRKRRTKAEIATIRSAMYDLLKVEQPMSVRQVFYRLVSKGVIEKSEKEYKNTVIRQLGVMRRAGDLPFDWVADSTRWMRKPTSYSSMESMLQRSASMYRQALWEDQNVVVEIWLEKEALAGVVYDVTAEWDVPLMVTRGYPRLSYLYAAAEALSYKNKPCYLYYFGDHDPSGLDIPRKVEADLRTFAPDAEIHFERVAVTLDQVKQFNLQTRPTKKTDSRSKGFVGESIEVDAIPPNKLREIVSDCIQRHIDPQLLARTLAVEKLERNTLQSVLETLGGNG